MRFRWALERHDSPVFGFFLLKWRSIVKRKKRIRKCDHSSATKRQKPLTSNRAVGKGCLSESCSSLCLQPIIFSMEDREEKRKERDSKAVRGSAPDLWSFLKELFCQRTVGSIWKRIEKRAWAPKDYNSIGEPYARDRRKEGVSVSEEKTRLMGSL